MAVPAAPVPMGADPLIVAQFAPALLQWQRTHGRSGMPWQNTQDPYRVWLSEIMLQQTQVSTVLDYYTRFLQRFPDVHSLAQASEDEVLGLWSGLGYYSRARNLHHCAQQVVALHGGVFPGSALALQTLSGIGPSTAAAIASFCFGERVAILDGNVRRALTRVLGFSADLALSANEKALWRLATELLPQQDVAHAMPRYTQGIMDLGATVCTSRQPLCLLCPAQTFCRGLASGEPTRYPVKTRKLKRSKEALSLLLAQRPDGSVWLQKRPSRGIWGGLYCLPIFASDEELKAFLPDSLAGRFEALPSFVHVLTHKDLQLSPWLAGFEPEQSMPVPDGEPAAHGAWFGPAEWPALGLPAPLRKLLEQEAS